MSDTQPDVTAPDIGQVTSPDAVDPYPLWAGARRQCPVQEITTNFADRPTFWVTRWDDAEAILRDNATFSSSINGETMASTMGTVLVGMDGAEHRRYRDLVAKAFRPSALARWGDELIAPTVHALLDRVAPRGRGDLVADLTHAFPVQIIAAILGVPVSDYAQFQRWAEDINFGPTDPGRSIPASRAMAEYLRPIVEDRRANRRDDLVSDIVHAEIDGERLDDDHIYGFLRLLLPAGAETTYRALGSCLYALLTHPGALGELRADRGLVPVAVEETLRWETSVTLVNRTPVGDVEVGGVGLPAGCSVLVATGSANRDEARYEHGDEWDLHRASRPHLAFGTGHHQCLGMHLARIEMRIAIEAVLDRLPNLRLDPDEPPPRMQGFAFRSPDRLPVRFDPS